MWDGARPISAFKTSNRILKSIRNITVNQRNVLIFSSSSKNPSFCNLHLLGAVDIYLANNEFVHVNESLCITE